MIGWFRRTQLAWHVLQREKARLLVALVGISFANLLIFMQLGFKEALFFSCGRVHRSFKGDLALVNPDFETLIAPQSFHRELLYRCLAAAEVSQVRSVRVGLLPWRNPKTGRGRSIQIVAFDPSFPMFNDPEVAAQAHTLTSLGNVLFDRLSRPEFGPIEKEFLAHPPVVTEVNRKHVEVSGLFSMGASFASDGCMLTSESTFARLFPDRNQADIEFGFVFLKPGANPEQVQASLQQLVGQAARVVSRQRLASVEEAYWANSTGIGFIFSMGAAMGFMVGVVIVYQILHGDVSDHLPQYATLKAMGYGNGFLLVMLTQESLLLAFLGYGPGLLLSLFLYHQASMATALPIFMTQERAVGALIGTIAMCILSAAIAARKLVSADPAEIF